MTTIPHVAAVVVTYNRLEKLKRGIAALRASHIRPQTILLVDNASTDGTGDYLATIAGDDDIHVLSLAENTGGAGGFAAGMERAHQLGADYFWVMDDDCYVEPNALGRLLEEHSAVEEQIEGRVPFACSLVKFVDGQLCEMNEAVTTWDWPRYWVQGFTAVKVTECTFVSALFPRWTIEEYGLPLAEYFIWYDDKEFTKRLTARAGAGIQVLDSFVVHDMGDNRGVNYASITEQNVWKFTYGVRNQSSFRWRHEGKLSWITYARSITVKMRRGGVSRALRRKVVRALFAGIRFDPQPRYPGTRQSIGTSDPA